ncbi:MarR family winged helix-turn-helix transcriptional regulator [Hydrogenophaga sp.]|uniref:MarR family winged helix-turn-helix transcriptional regulator n=1 Tax=Hydrogenophaga sp. TaxID=1904254 RepID=UPI0035626370
MTKKKTATATPAPGRRALADQMGNTLMKEADPLQADPIFGNSDVLVSQWNKQFAGEDVRALTLGIRIRRIAMLLDELSIQECEAVGLKLNEWLLMMALRRMGEPYCLRPTDILKMHSVTSGTATYRIDQLTKQGLAERIADPSDRRGYLIRLTPRGLEIIDTVLHGLRVNFHKKLLPMFEIEGGFEIFEESLRLYERCMEQGD